MALREVLAQVYKADTLIPRISDVKIAGAIKIDSRRTIELRTFSRSPITGETGVASTRYDHDCAVRQIHAFYLAAFGLREAQDV